LAELHRVLKPGGILICSITRTSFFGAVVHLKWRTHCVSRSVALSWLANCGFRSAKAVSFPRNSAARRFSIGYVGQKPKDKGAHLVQHAHT
jgi:hypothetical protein